MSWWQILCAVFGFGFLLLIIASVVQVSKKKSLKQEHDVEGLIKMMSSSWATPDVAEALAEMGDVRATEVLIDTIFRKRREDMRLAANEALVQLWHSLDGDSRRTIALALCNKLLSLGSEALKPLVSAELRDAALETLGEIRDPQAVEPLITLLNDPNKDVRRVAAQALGQIGDARAVEALGAAGFPPESSESKRPTSSPSSRDIQRLIDTQGFAEPEAVEIARVVGEVRKWYWDRARSYSGRFGGRCDNCLRPLGRDDFHLTASNSALCENCLDQHLFAHIKWEAAVLDMQGWIGTGSVQIPQNVLSVAEEAARTITGRKTGGSDDGDRLK